MIAGKRLLEAVWRLAVLVFEIASILVAGFVVEVGVQHGIQAGDAPVFFDVIVAEAGPAVGIGGLRLNARWRVPAQPVVAEGGAVPVRDHPIEFGEVDDLIADAGHSAEFVGGDHAQSRL